MKDAIFLLFKLLIAIARLLGNGGSRAIIAENLLLKKQPPQTQLPQTITQIISLFPTLVHSELLVHAYNQCVSNCHAPSSILKVNVIPPEYDPSLPESAHLAANPG